MSKPKSGEHPAVREYETTLETVRTACRSKLDEQDRKLDEALHRLLLSASAAAEEDDVHTRATLPSVPS